MAVRNPEYSYSGLLFVLAPPLELELVLIRRPY
jgi:hypothetical protein